MNLFLKGRFKYLSIAVVVCALAVIFFWRNARVVDTVTHRHDISIYAPGGIELETHVADSQSERTIGLSRHAFLAPDQAMLFVFDRSGYYGFHMPDMDFPIDIFWLNKDKEVVFIKPNARPEDYPEVYTSTQQAIYVLETVSGFAELHTVSIGDRFTWEYLKNQD